MSEEPQRGMMGPPPPPPPSHPPPAGPAMPQRVIPQQFPYIPGQEGSYEYYQSNHHPHHPAASPLNTWDNSGSCGSFPIPPHPSQHHHLPPPPPPHLHGNPPPPMFTCPPPPTPPPPVPPHAFPQPPPALPRTPNIPYQAAFLNPPMLAPVAPVDTNVMWHPQHNPPPGTHPHPQCHQQLLQGDRGPAPVTPQCRVMPEGAAGRHILALLKEEEDLKWVEEFEKRVKSSPPSPPLSSPPPTESTTTAITTKKNVKLAEVERLVVESWSLKEQLCGLEEELTQRINSAQEDEWESLVKQTEEIKVNLNQILENFQNQEFVTHTKFLLKQRRAKRNRVKRRKKQRQLEKEELRRKREEEEAKIDAWRGKLQREEDAKRREEAVKREADSVLSEVRQKQSEGQRMLQLLESLATLRHTRATQAAAQGQAKDSEADQRFTKTTEVIGKLVKQQLKEYELEEQTLRVMMEESASHRSAALSAKGDANMARYQDSIRKLLFGPTAASDTHQDDGLSLETLVQRRQEWDQYVVDGDSLLSSAVPLSWVLPPAQPHPSWAAFLLKR